MPILCDFIAVQDSTGALIHNGNPVTIDDSAPVFQGTFHTGGRHSDGQALLILTVSGLTHTDQHVPVRVNSVQIGLIRNYFPGGSDVVYSDPADPNKARQRDHVYTQVIQFPGTVINNGNNTIEIDAVTFPGNSASNHYDGFTLFNIVCFFNQKS